MGGGGSGQDSTLVFSHKGFLRRQDALVVGLLKADGNHIDE